jgi:hypothetical protein
MSSGISRITKGRFAQGIVIFFLLYTALDIATPQNCNQELLGLRRQQVIAGSSFKMHEGVDHTPLAVTNKSRNNQPDSAPSQEEDCFCCCSHIVLGLHFVPPTVFEFRSPEVTLDLVLIPSPPLRIPFRPPRVA